MSAQETTEAYEVLPLTPLRKIIANRMVEAKQRIPHFRVTNTVEMDKLLVLRKDHNIAHPSQKISVNDLIIKACAIALMEVPEINIQFVEGEVHQYKQADISVVIAVDGGLTTPVIRGADQKTVQEINLQVRDFAERARAGRLKMPEIMGGSFSISNLGMYDVDQFDAIINPPQGAILAVGSAKSQAIVRDDEIQIATCLKLSLSLDHRVLDGTVGATFLSALRSQLESPEELLET